MLHRCCVSFHLTTSSDSKNKTGEKNEEYDSELDGIT
jgi:hypothetical protein